MACLASFPLQQEQVDSWVPWEAVYHLAKIIQHLHSRSWALPSTTA